MLGGRDPEVVKDPQVRIAGCGKGKDEELVPTPWVDQGVFNEPKRSKNVLGRGKCTKPKIPREAR
jgi:hypothetical protein